MYLIYFVQFIIISLKRREGKKSCIDEHNQIVSSLITLYRFALCFFFDPCLLLLLPVATLLTHTITSIKNICTHLDIVLVSILSFQSLALAAYGYIHFYFSTFLY
jgi:hypothetical protein